MSNVSPELEMAREENNNLQAELANTSSELFDLQQDWGESQAWVRELEEKLETARLEITDAWHKNAYGQRELHECLGMSAEEYGVYASSGAKALYRYQRQARSKAEENGSDADEDKPNVVIPTIQAESVWHSEYLAATFKVLGLSDKDPGLVRCLKIDEETQRVLDDEIFLFPEYEFGHRLKLVEVAH